MVKNATRFKQKISIDLQDKNLNNRKDQTSFLFETYVNFLPRLLFEKLIWIELIPNYQKFIQNYFSKRSETKINNKPNL